ncbi:MAG: hypothetical protein JMDDDDMK_04642 [Acidobacteria bacterium]|nr:hypothetical protein [Acidobacteriota bacterium]
MAVSFQVNLFDVRIVELHVGAERLQFLDDAQRGAFAHVVNVTFVSYAHDQNLRSVDRLAMIVESTRHQINHVIGHARIDFLGQRDESRLEAVHPRLPRQVMRVERDAMPADARPRIKRHESEWFGRRRRDHFPGVNAQRVAEPRQFIHQTDVDGAERVFKQLARFGHARGTDRMHLFNNCAVNRRRYFGAGFSHAADNFGDVFRVELFIARINAFRRERQEIIVIELQPGLIKDWLQDFVRRAGIGR